jgi:hypothetical protein
MALEFSEEDLRIWELIEKWKKEEELKGAVPEDRIDECAGKVKEMSSGGGEGDGEEEEEGTGEEEEEEEGEEKKPKEEEEEKLPPVDEERVKNILKYGVCSCNQYYVTIFYAMFMPLECRLSSNFNVSSLSETVVCRRSKRCARTSWRRACFVSQWR